MKKAFVVACAVLFSCAGKAYAQVNNTYVMPGSGFPSNNMVRPGFGYGPGVLPPYAPQYGYTPPGYGYNQFGQYTYGGAYGNPFIYQPYMNMNWGMPQPVGASYFSIRAGGTNFNFWHAPSGYYYPWGAVPQGFAYTYAAPTLYNGTSGTDNLQPSQPPLSTVFSDLTKYLDEAKKNNKIEQGQFTHLRQRALDLQAKASDLRMQGGGTLDPSQEQLIRRDLDQVSVEVSKAVKP